MSVKAMTWYFGLSPDLPYSSAEWRVLNALCWKHKENGYCGPSIETLAKLSKMPERSVKRALKGLKKHGAIVIIRRSANGKTLSNNYAIKGVSDKQVGVTSFTPLEGCHTDTPTRGDTVTPNRQYLSNSSLEGAAETASNVVSFRRSGGGNV